jgi:hypothetical protein
MVKGNMEIEDSPVEHVQDTKTLSRISEVSVRQSELIVTNVGEEEEKSRYDCKFLPKIFENFISYQ